MLEGVLVMVGMPLEVGHEVLERNSKGAGESIEEQDIVSKSGVRGSRYGFDVLMKETGEELCQ